MILVTAFLAGVAASMLRSAFAVIMVAFLIPAVFGLAAMFGTVHFMSLVYSILGYNAGLVVMFGGHLLLADRRRKSH